MDTLIPERTGGIPGNRQGEALEGKSVKQHLSLIDPRCPQVFYQVAQV